MKPLNARVESILTDKRTKKNKLERLREALKLISLEIEKNRIEVEGLISNKIVFQVPKDKLKRLGGEE